MKRTKRKVLTGSMLLLALTTMATACSSGNQSSPSSAPSNSPVGGNPVATAPANEAEKKDYGTIYVYANMGNLSNTTDSSKPEVVAQIKQYIKEHTGVTVEVIIPPKGNEEEKLNVLLASNEPIDVFKGNMAQHQAMGAVMPLNELLDEYGSNIKKLWPEEWAKGWNALSTPDGKIWGVPENPPLVGNTLYIREDWLKQLSLETPKTIDEFEEVLKALKEQDPAGNGQTIPLLTNFNDMNLGLAAGWMEHGHNSFVDTDGKVKHPVLHPGYRDFVATMADWYNKGYIYKESFSSNRDRQIELVKQNRVGAGLLWYTTVSNNMSAIWNTDPDAWYIVPELQGPKGNIYTSRGVATTGWMISKKSKNPEGVMRYYDWLHSDIENYFTVLYGMKDVHWKYHDKENKVIELMNYKEDYMGELIIGSTFAYSVQFSQFSDAGKQTADYVRNNLTDLGRAKMPALLDYDYQFDAKAIADKVPNKSDIDTKIEQEVVKFIMGSRPMSEYDKFLEELNKAGMDKWIDAYTEQYEKAKAAG